jgi:hypothetical protein
MCFIYDVTMECTHFIIWEVVGWEGLSAGERPRRGTSQTHCLLCMRDIYAHSRDDSPSSDFSDVVTELGQRV